MGTQYYLDAVNGDDASGDGSSQSPWKTLYHAQQVLNSGDKLILHNANQHAAEEPSGGHPNWIIFKVHQDTACITWRKTYL